MMSMPFSVEDCMRPLAVSIGDAFDWFRKRREPVMMELLYASRVTP